MAKDPTVHSRLCLVKKWLLCYHSVRQYSKFQFLKFKIVLIPRIEPKTRFPSKEELKTTANVGGGSQPGGLGRSGTRSSPKRGFGAAREPQERFLRKSLGGLAGIPSHDPKTSQCRGLPPRNKSPGRKSYFEPHRAHNVQNPPIIVCIVKPLYRAGISEFYPGISS